MGRRTLLLLCLVWLVSGHDASKNAEWIFSYNGNISVYSSTSDNIQSQWGIDAVLTLQKLENLVAAQFSDVKTVSFNGEARHSVGLGYRNIPEDAHALLKPFTIHYDGDLVKGIAHEPDDVLWSVNMKRSIASFMQIDRKLPAQSKEKLSYGDCTVDYTHERSGDTITLKKLFNEYSCVKPIWQEKKNLVNYMCIDHLVYEIKRNVNRTYTLQKQEGDWVIKKIVAEADVRQKTISGAEDVYNMVFQRQVFDLTSVKPVETPINFADAHVKTSLTFVQNSDVTQGREVQLEATPWRSDDFCDPKKANRAHVNQWIMYGNALDTEWKKKTLEERNLRDHQDYLKDMLELMKRINFDTFSAFLRESKGELINNAFFSLLPLVGTSDSIKYIKFLIKNHEPELEGVALQLLTTFPPYINNRTDETLKKMEFLLNLDNNHIVLQQTGILSFAQIVRAAYYSNECTEATYNGYIKRYLKHLNNAVDYNTKLVYLEGLHNLKVEPEVLWSFIQNDQESYHLRTRAMNAIKDYFSVGEAFEKYFPMLRNESLPFEMRVASLDMILRYSIDSDKLEELVKYLTSSEDIEHLHLYNYFYTTVTAISKREKCGVIYAEHIDAFKKLTKPKSNRLWANGNYRREYSDVNKNYGVSAEAKLFGDPVTNIVTSARLAYGLFVEYDSYEVHLNLQGLPYTLYEFIRGYIGSDHSVKQILDILSKTNLTALYPQDINIEIVLYSNRNAIFATQINLKNKKQVFKIFEPIFTLLQFGSVITHPIVDYEYSTSDLGTTLSKEIGVKGILKGDYHSRFIPTTDKNSYGGHTEKSVFIRNLWSSEVALRSYNPIDNTKFSVTKFQKTESVMNLDFERHRWESMISWKENADKPLYHQKFDYFVYTSASNHSDLVETCPKCHSKVIVEESEKTEKGTIPLVFIGKTLEIESSNITSIRELLSKEHFRPTSVYNGLNIVSPTLYHLFLGDTTYLLPNLQYYRTSFKIKSADPDVAETRLYYSAKSYAWSLLSFGASAKFSLHFQQTYKNGDIAGFWNITSQQSTTDSDDSTASTETMTIRANSALGKEERKLYRMCFDVSANLPNGRNDIFSMLPVDPTEFNVSFSMGKHDLKTPSCPTENTVDIKGILTVLEDQAEIVEKAEVEPYKTCKADSLHYKYTQPSKSCIEAAAKSSTYRNYFFNVKMNQVSEDFTKTMSATSQYLEQYGINKPITVGEHFSAEDFNVSAVFHAGEPKVVLSVNHYSVPLPIATTDGFGEIILLRPTKYYLLDIFEKLGITSTCIITPKFVKTFSDKYIWDYESKLNVDKVAYIDCSNRTSYALLFNKAKETELALSVHTWYGFVDISSSDGTNGFSVTRDGKPNEYAFPVEYLSDNSSLQIMKSSELIYFNKEYVHVSMLTINMRSTCGLCSFQEENVSVPKS